MKYYVKTKHQDGNDYVCVETKTIGAALNYAIEPTLNKEIVLIVTNEHNDEICIAFNGCLYQEGVIRDILEYAKEIEEDYE